MAQRFSQRIPKKISEPWQNIWASPLINSDFSTTATLKNIWWPDTKMMLSEKISDASKSSKGSLKYSIYTFSGRLKVYKKF